jgi:hypothetical protein
MDRGYASGGYANEMAKSFDFDFEGLLTVVILSGFK